MKEVIFIPFQHDSELVQALKDETIQLSISVSPGSIETIRELPQITFRSMPTLSIGFLSMNTTKAPFINIKVRKAISYAINKNELTKKYFYGRKTGLPAQTFLPSPMFESNAESIEQEYNLEKAKKLLKEAGYADGFTTTLMPTAVRRPYFPEPMHIAEDIKKELSGININVQIVQAKSWQDFLNHMHDGTFDMMLYGWLADTIDPSDMLSALLTTRSINAFNSSRWSNKKFDLLIEKTRSQKNLAARTQLYREAEVEFIKEMPFVPLFNPLQVVAWNEKIKGFTPHPINRLYLEYLYWESSK